MTPLMAAAALGRTHGVSRVTESSALEAVKLALERGGDVNAVNAAGDTALHGAAAMGVDTIVQVLVDEGAKLNVKNKRGWTPLIIAEGVYEGGVINRLPNTAALLLKLGAEPSPPDVERDSSAVDFKLNNPR